MARSLWKFILLACLTSISIGCGGGGQTPTPTPTPVSTNTVTITFLGPSPTAVAEKIGTGGWTTALLPNNGTLLLTLPSGTTQYGVAVVCNRTVSGAMGIIEWVLEADLKDGSAYNLRFCLPNSPSTQPTGNISGSFDASAIPGIHTVNFSVDYGSAAFLGSSTGTFNISASTGVTDLYGLAYDNSGNILTMKILRSQTIPSVANAGNTITFTASNAVTVQPISIANISSGFSSPIMFSGYVSAHGSFPVDFAGFPAGTQYAAVPATDVQPGEYYFFNAVSGTATQQVYTQQYLLTAAPVTLTLPKPWSPAPPAPAVFPAFTFDYTGLVGQTATADNATIGWSQGSISFGVDVIATGNFQNGSTRVTIPDLTSLPGFFSMAPAGSSITWSATTWGGAAQWYQGSAPLLFPLTTPQTISNASGQGTYTQP